ncbi:MAG TPA: DedA family protein [Acidimicrobiia bacterium]|nr:DedA family protein [Acidimicrobiia bacterium]
MLDGLVDWVTSVVETLGYGGVAFLVALENLFPPIPSEVVLPLAGFVASSGDASLVGMIVAATIGSMVGAFLLYGIAAAVGPIRLRALVVRHGRWFGLDETDLDKTEEWFDRKANSAVLICRCIPLMRSLISIPAGFRRMRLVPFTIFTLAGSLVWNVLLIGAGYLLGEQWNKVEAPLELFQTLVLLVIGLALAWFIWRKIVRPRLRGAAG